MKDIACKVYFLVLSCLSGLLSADFAEEAGEITDKIKFLGEIAFKPDHKKQLLGASSIRYDAKNKRFIILSDDTGAYTNVFGIRGQPRYYTFELSDIWSEGHQTFLNNLSDTPPRLSSHPIVSSNKLKDIYNGNVDLESITTFDQDELLVVSENGVWEWDAYPSLIKVSKLGRLKGYYRFPDHYTNDQSFIRAASHAGKMHEDIYAKGIKRNKGIESLDRIGDTNDYIAIMEAPLIQDERKWNYQGITPVRLLHFSMDEFTGSNDETGTVSLKGEYFYPLEPLPEDLSRNALQFYPKRSISDVEVINEHYAVVLEKSYIKYRYIDKRKPKSYFELYLVQLESAYNFAYCGDIYPNEINDKKHGSNRVLKKTLLMRSTWMKDQAPEFDRLNVEGVTLGPEFSDGSRLLVLVNDNDAYHSKVPASWSEPLSQIKIHRFLPAFLFTVGNIYSAQLLLSTKEPTHLMFFKIPAAMLGKK